jgi:hypothetical protein
MAAPQFVPVSPTHEPRVYTSPPRRGEWWAKRPGEVVDDGQPHVDEGRMGAPGPDQGYVLKLLPLLRGELELVKGEDLGDVEAGAVVLALKRASLFGRAPIIHDLRVAYTTFGFLDANTDPELVKLRRRLFTGARHAAHHYPEIRAIADAVPADTLRMSPDEVAQTYSARWQSLLGR